MKKLLAVLVALFVALCISASAAIMPAWMENLNPGDSFTSGEYSVSKGFAEPAFTPTTFDSTLTFGDGVTGGSISQSLSTSIGGVQIGDVDRQFMGQSAYAFVAASDSGFYWDPENPDTAVVAQMGITKDQFAKFSGALVAGEGALKQGIDINADGEPDDHYGGSHLLQWYDVTDPAWTATFSDEAYVGTSNLQLNQEVTDAAVTISADVDTNNYYQIIDPNCVGYEEIWKGVWPYETFVADNGNLADYASADNAQLTELGATMSSDVTLTQTRMNLASGPIEVIGMDGSASLGGEFEDAFLDPMVKLGIDINTGTTPFNFWWSLPAP